MAGEAVKETPDWPNIIEEIEGVGREQLHTVRTVSITERRGQYPWESAWNTGSSNGSRYRRTTSWPTRSATVGIPSGRVPPDAFGMSTTIALYDSSTRWFGTRS